MLELQEIKRARDKVMRRQSILENAVKEYDEAVQRALKQAETKIISRPLKVVEIARLLDVNPSTVNRMGSNHCRSYAEIHSWVKENRPDLLNRLEKNYQSYLKEEGR